MTHDLVKARGSRDVAIYNPESGLQTIVTVAAAEKHWRRVIRSAKALQDDRELRLAVKNFRIAVETRILEQAAYVKWRDSVVAAHVGPKRDGKGGKISALKSNLPPGDPGDVTAHRWRKRFGTSEKLEAALIEAALRCDRASSFEPIGTERGTAGTGEFERYTPAEYIEAAREMMGTIDLDPASNKIAQKTVKAAKYYTVKDDGLTKEWHGNVWLNPPYHRDLQPAFIEKMIEEVAVGHVAQAIMLTNNSTDTEWFLKAAQAAALMCFTVGRVAFTTPTGEELAPTQGQAFFYFGSNAVRFAEVFARIGFGVTLTFRHRSIPNE